MNIKKEIQKDIYEVLKDFIEQNEILIEKPKEKKNGDYAIPCFQFSKLLHKSPNEIANTLKDKIKNTIYQKIEVVGGYCNIFLEKKVIVSNTLNRIMTEKDQYGSNSNGNNKTIVVEYSSPNIAKPFGIGHLRSTVIGEALKRINQKNGYKVYTANFIGDYGTQFGKVLYAYNTWGDYESVRKNPTEELRNLYIKFHEEAKKDPSLDEKGREWFRKLEEKDPDAVKLWSWFRDESLKEFKQMYQFLGISEFDNYNGEAYYKDLAYKVIDTLEEKKILKSSEGAKVVDVGDDIIPALIQKSDGTSIYITRDLAAYLDRLERYHFDEILYVVGNEQSLHFEQMKRILKKLGENDQKLKYINFGLLLQDGKKMSTRGGTSLNLQGLLERSILLAKQLIREKNPNLKNQDEISRMIGIGAVIFNDLKNNRINDIEFNLDEILSFTGTTGPYVQYTNARIHSLLEHLEDCNIDYDRIEINEYVWDTVLDLYEFPEVIIKSRDNYDPSIIARYLLNLSSDYNKLYGNVKMIDQDKTKTTFNLTISRCVSVVLIEGMRLLGIQMPDQM